MKNRSGDAVAVIKYVPAVVTARGWAKVDRTPAVTTEATPNTSLRSYASLDFNRMLLESAPTEIKFTNPAGILMSPVATPIKTHEQGTRCINILNHQQSF